MFYFMTIFHDTTSFTMFSLTASIFFFHIYWRKRPCLTICSAFNTIGLFTLTVCCVGGARLRCRFDWSIWLYVVRWNCMQNQNGHTVSRGVLETVFVFFFSWLDQVESCALTSHLGHCTFNVYSWGKMHFPWGLPALSPQWIQLALTNHLGWFCRYLLCVACSVVQCVLWSCGWYQILCWKTYNVDVWSPNLNC